MEKDSIEEIKQPSDLFGYEIIKGCTFESEYGKLTLSPLFIPDFSSDEKGSIRMKEEFDFFKSFIVEKDLLKKLEIAEQIIKNEFSNTILDGQLKLSNFVLRSSATFSDFIIDLKENMQARLFEMGLSINFDLCSSFAYEGRLSKGMIFYNDIRVVQPFSCAGGLFLFCLKYALNPGIFCPRHYQDIKEQILEYGLPNHHYLSWAFYNASFDEDMLSFLVYVKRCGY